MILRPLSANCCKIERISDCLHIVRFRGVFVGVFKGEQHIQSHKPSLIQSCVKQRILRKKIAYPKISYFLFKP